MDWELIPAAQHVTPQSTFFKAPNILNSYAFHSATVWRSTAAASIFIQLFFFLPMKFFQSRRIPTNPTHYKLRLHLLKWATHLNRWPANPWIQPLNPQADSTKTYAWQWVSTQLKKKNWEARYVRYGKPMKRQHLTVENAQCCFWYTDVCCWG